MHVPSVENFELEIWKNNAFELHKFQTVGNAIAVVKTNLSDTCHSQKSNFILNDE